MDTNESDAFKIGRSCWGEFKEDVKPEHKKIVGKVLLELPRTTEVVDDIIKIPQHLEKSSCSTSNSSAASQEIPEGTVSLKEEIVNCVTLKDSSYFKSQQRGEADLSYEEKKTIATSLLDSSPSKFLSRFGKFLRLHHLSHFDQFHDDYEVNFYVRQLDKSLKHRSSVVKNRRYQAMNELIEKGEYFSLNEMRKRNPLLFGHLVEKYMSEEEKHILNQARLGECELSTVLMAHMDRDQYSSTRRKEQEAEQSAWDEEEEEGEEEEEEEDEKEVVDAEKDLLKEEFVSTMYRSFLEGCDKDFDYSSVDDDSRYDDILQQERDEQEKYFDDD